MTQRKYSKTFVVCTIANIVTVSALIYLTIVSIRQSAASEELVRLNHALINREKVQRELDATADRLFILSVQYTACEYSLKEAERRIGKATPTKGSHRKRRGK